MVRKPTSKKGKAGLAKETAPAKASLSKSKGRPASKREGSNTGTSLVVVESPAKARTIERILGPNFIVKASQGHVRDLPKGQLGVNIENGFSPSYSVLKDKQAIVQELKKLGERASCIYLATDPDREGEAISWHLVKGGSMGQGRSTPKSSCVPRDNPRGS